LATTSDDPKVLAVAFAHDAPAPAQSGRFVSVLINGAKTEKVVRLAMDGLAPELDAYVTSASTSLWAKPTRVARHAIVLPARSIMTLVDTDHSLRLDPPKSSSPMRSRPRVSPPPGPAPPLPQLR
jgi:hypothetical protein